GEQQVVGADDPAFGVGVFGFAEATAQGLLRRLQPDLHDRRTVGREQLFERAQGFQAGAQGLAGQFIARGFERRAREPVADDDGDAAFGRDFLPVRPEERPAFGRGRVGRADAHRAGVEPFRQLVGESGGREAVVAADDDDRAILLGREAALGRQEAEVEGGAGSLKDAAGGHRRRLCRPPSRMGSAIE
ncbi:MAG: hypothetical protein AN484_24780, partial [Aphanizomenon flos-aquae WA102]